LSATAQPKPRLLICVGWLITGAGQTTVVCEEVKHLCAYFEITVLTDRLDLQTPIAADIIALDRIRSRWARACAAKKAVRNAAVVHCHDSLKFMLVASMGRKPLVITSHGILPFRFRTSSLDRLNCVVTTACYRFLYRRATVLVGISPYICTWLRRYAHREPVLISNGAPVSKNLSQSKSPASEACKRALYVGHVSERKGIADLVRLATVLSRDWRIDVVGDGELDKFVDSARQSGVDGCITFHGRLNDDVLQKLISTSTVMISASHWEGFGLPILEGFSAGIPAVVRRSSNLAELIASSSAGEAFDNIDEVPMLLRRITTDWVGYSNRASHFAQINSWDRRMSEYRNLFEGVLPRSLSGHA
jgi:alpha-1,3-mannosyltransferase